MRFQVPIIVAFIAHLAQSNPVLPNNLQARTLEDGRKQPTRDDTKNCENGCAEKHPGRVPGRESKISLRG
ncbi:hypothetical protein PpBr36_05516 [Pyricularia pennisetigena]|uniref:hypothetical protein n=1 Tax=Pyricularia pennisetigena TaxID=1578925 RepID=UPI00114E8EFF|nr:hypothetical protein PpBr36_05516 [Pyricularia pennisetigena]TLS26463.1 hypothetical protein PpBr36_05516 [Pyricularia pennisetigena]